MKTMRRTGKSGTRARKTLRPQGCLSCPLFQKTKTKAFSCVWSSSSVSPLHLRLLLRHLVGVEVLMAFAGRLVCAWTWWREGGRRARQRRREGWEKRGRSCVDFVGVYLPFVPGSGRLLPDHQRLLCLLHDGRRTPSPSVSPFWLLWYEGETEGRKGQRRVEVWKKKKKKRRKEEKENKIVCLGFLFVVLVRVSWLAFVSRLCCR